MQLLVRPAAASDVDAAFDWYEARRRGLGHEFLAAVNGALEAVRLRADSFPVVHRNTRRALLRRFPYAIYFRVYPEAIVVVACMHGHRDPRRWKARN